MRYEINCFRCNTKFDGSTARWCDDQSPSSLICTHCGSCFCSAPLPYKRAVWLNAPRELRENPRRFGHQIITMPPRAKTLHERPVVLVVDDDEAMRALVMCVVEHLGYRAIESADPFDVIAIASGNYVDVIITDALMPKMDGRAMCRRIKDTPEGARMKVIVMTSLYKSHRFRSEAIHHYGADDYLTKPINFSSLADMLERLAPLQGSPALRAAIA